MKKKILKLNLGSGKGHSVLEVIETFNIVIGATYLIYKYFLVYFLSAPIAIWSISFTNFRR